MRIAFDNSYARLPERFFARVVPTPVAAPRLVALNDGLAADLGLDAAHLRTAEGAEILAGVRVPEGSEPLAQAYAGHQFGQFVPQLGDGRAVLLGEVTGRDGRRADIQLKGSGPTPFSRRGDGRAALGPVLREYIVSEAMHALGIPTTRTLAAVTTGEPVYRETALPGAVLTRVAASHVRVGTFQYFAARGDVEALRFLAEHVIARHYPDAAEAADPALALLEGMARRQAHLVARWLGAGFIHGVMNTDNCQIAGETIDYGPCAFMDAYDPATVFSSIDHFGRYAYANQPKIAQWNVARFAECLLPLIGSDQEAAAAAANEIVGGFALVFEQAFTEIFAAKIGLTQVREGDVELIRALLKAMHETGADFTLTFRRLADAAAGDVSAVAELFAGEASFDAWIGAWRQRLAAQGLPVEAVRAAMRSVNPAFIPRNHRVEQALAAATTGDLAPFRRLNAILSRPFDDQPENAAYMDAPSPEERVEATFCGT